MSLQIHGNGGNNSLLTATSTLLRNKATYSIALWAKWVSGGTSPFGFARGTTDGTDSAIFLLRADTNAKPYSYAYWSDASQTDITGGSNGDIDADTWYLWILTVTDGAQAQYINGTAKGAGTQAGKTTVNLNRAMSLVAGTDKIFRFERYAAWVDHVLTEGERAALLAGTAPDAIATPANWYVPLNKTTGSFDITDTELDDAVGSLDFATATTAADMSWSTDSPLANLTPRASGRAPLGVFFNAVDTTSAPAHTSGVVQPVNVLASKSISVQPVNITGAVVLSCTQDSAVGDGTLAYTAATHSFTWAEAGDSAGSPIAFTVDAVKQVTSANGNAIALSVDYSALPVGDQSDTVTVLSTDMPDHSRLYYEWDFGDTESGTWSTTGRSKNSAYGHIAAHVYEGAGSYTVTLTVTDESGTEHVYTQAITVTAATGNTYYVSNAGDDEDAGSEVAPFATLAHAVSVAAAEDTILLNRGDTFAASASMSISTAGPIVVAAYGTGAKPIINADLSGSLWSMQAGSVDWRWVDLDVRGVYDYDAQTGSPCSGFASRRNYSLMLRCDLTGLDYGIVDTSAGSLYPGAVDCTFIGNKSYGAYCTVNSPTDDPIIGPYFLGCEFDGTRTEHLLRSGASHVLISNSTFVRAAATKVYIKLTGRQVLSATAVTPNKFSLISENEFTEPSGTSHSIISAGSADNAIEHVTDCVIECNTFINENVGSNGTAIHSRCAERMTVRNNKSKNFQIFMYLDPDSVAVGWSNLKLLGNTWSTDETADAFFLMAEVGTPAKYTHQITLKNNIGYMPNVLVSGGGSSIILDTTGDMDVYTSDYNCWYAPLFKFWVEGSIRDFANWKTNSGEDANSIVTDPALGSTLAPDPASDCVGGGVALDSLRDDFSRLTRIGETYNIGAYQSTISAPTVTTSPASSIGATSATAGGNVTDDGGAAVTARGVCWSTTDSTPTLDSCDGFTTDGTGTGAFASTLSPLPGGTLIYHNAYATNSVGSLYGTADDFTTLAGDPATGASISADGESLVLTWTREGGWPVDMDVFATAVCTVLVAGTRNIQAEVGGIVVVDGETLTITRTLESLVYANETVVVVAVEAGTGYSEANSETIRTAAFTAGTLVTNDSAVANPDTNNGRLDRITRVNNRLALR